MIYLLAVLNIYEKNEWRKPEISELFSYHGTFCNIVHIASLDFKL